MKKYFAIMLLLLLVLLMAAPALAVAEPGDPEFYTWVQLLTYPGCLAATLGIVELIKDLPGIKRLPTRIVAYIIALGTMLLATYVSGQWDTGAALLCIINAVVVALAANGMYDAAAAKKAE